MILRPSTSHDCWLTCLYLQSVLSEVYAADKASNDKVPPSTIVRLGFSLEVVNNSH